MCVKQDLESALIESKAKWKIVIGHHTIKSASDHGNTQELVDKVLPILEVCIFLINNIETQIYRTYLF